MCGADGGESVPKPLTEMVWDVFAQKDSGRVQGCDRLCRLGAIGSERGGIAAFRTKARSEIAH